MRRPRQPRRDGAEQGSALIIALVFLVVFAMLAGAVAQLATGSLRTGETVGDHSDTLFGADDASERTQVAIEQNLDPVCQADATIKPYVHDGDTYLVRCSYLKEGENPLPGIHFAMMLFSKDEWALTKTGSPAASLTGDIRLNTAFPCFRFAPDGFVNPFGVIACTNPPDERSGRILGVDQYSPVGPIRFRANSEGAQGVIDVRSSDCSGSGWLPSPVDMASAHGGPHLQNANNDGSGPYTSFTNANWTCHTDDLVDSDPDYPLPDQVADGTLPTQSSAGTYEDCSSTPQWFNVGYPVLMQYSCVRHFTPGRYTSNPTLDLTASYGYNGKSTGVRANIFDPGVYWFDTDDTVPPQPWFPEPGLSFSVKDQYRDAPVVMGTADSRIRANTTWTNTNIVAQIPIGERCLAGEPGVEMVFNPGYGMVINPVTGGAGFPSAQVTACQLRPGQVAGGQPGIVLYQKKYPAADWDGGFTNWPAGNPSPWPQHPAWGTFALFNSADNVSSGGLVMDGFVYAPHGIIKTAVGLVSTSGTQIASGIIAFSLQLKAVGAGGQMVANEQPRFAGKYLVEIWNCGTAVDAAACGIDAKPADARALVDAAVPGGSGPTPIRFDRWLPN
ncbi:MAG: pilus assembly PilX N-terminal domain-containing protein [Acidimicrobiia bacterium]|nr:pilus assembly PilX N-terminal domain-containing protein [Acidimicrobiia bacterium]